MDKETKTSRRQELKRLDASLTVVRRRIEKQRARVARLRKRRSGLKAAETILRTLEDTTAGLQRTRKSILQELGIGPERRPKKKLPARTRAAAIGKPRRKQPSGQK